MPDHDELTGENVIKTALTPHRVTPTKLAAARAAPLEVLTRLKSPRVAVLIGGDSVNHRFKPPISPSHPSASPFWWVPAPR